MFIVNLAGHLGKDPETRFTPSGQKVTSFNIATNHRKGKEDVTIWVRVTVWGDRLDKMISYLKKGSAVVVTGRMNPPAIYQDKEGRTQVNLEVTAEMIEFSPFGKSDRPNEGQSHSSSGQYDESQFQSNPSSQYNKPSTYGSQSSGSSAHYSQSVDEDALPF
ncbi:MAG: single-stranded DNA-binding protein [Parachlamydiaceae bacterium]